jgi:hypothetical protein
MITVWATLHQGEPLDEHLLAALHTPANQRLKLIETLCLENKWLRTDDGFLRPVASGVLEWLKSTPWSQWSSLAQAWMASTEWNDLAAVPGLNPDRVHGWPNDPLETRRGFLEVLRRCEPEMWYDLKTFVGYVKAEAPYFLRQDGDFESWAPRDAETESPLRGFETWDAVEGALVEYLITGPLHWLGFTSLGVADPSEAPTVFALTDAGLAFLDKAPPPEMPAPPPIRLTPEGDLIVPHRRRYERFQLSRIADIVAAPQVYHYRLSPSSLARARRQRIAYGRITSFLAEVTGREGLPAHLTSAIQKAYEGAGSAKIQQLWILRVSEPKYLTLPDLVDLIEERLAPTVAVIREEDRDRALRVLVENGLLTELEVDGGEQP